MSQELTKERNCLKEQCQNYTAEEISGHGTNHPCDQNGFHEIEPAEEDEPGAQGGYMIQSVSVSNIQGRDSAGFVN